MNPYIIALLAIVTFLLATEELATHWLQIQLQPLAVRVWGLAFRTRLQVRLSLDRYSFTKSNVLARAIRSWQLRQIQNNPAYSEFFTTTPTDD